MNKEKRGKQEFSSLAPEHTLPFRTLIKEKGLRQERVAEETYRDVRVTKRYVISLDKDYFYIP